ncbi:MAG: hypothetical protein ACRDD7_16380 [Peptostreptococcaceae bacterium]
MGKRKIDHDKAKDLLKQGLTHLEVANIMGVTRSSISSIAKRAGIISKKRKVWSDSEVEYLKEKYGEISLNRIAIKLNCSKEQVRTKAYNLGLGGLLENSEYLTAKELNEITGYSRCVIAKWINEGLLNARKNKVKKVNVFYQINIDDIWKFINSYEKFDSTRIEKGALGKEPKWIEERRREDAIKYPKRNWEALASQALSLYTKGYTHNEIQAKLNVSKSYICNLIKKNKKNRVIQLSWREIEVKMLVEMVANNYTYRQMSEEMGRSMDSIRKKKYELIQNNLIKIEG